MKVFLLAEKPTANRTEFYNLLSRQCDLTVAFERYPAENSIWQFNQARNSFTAVFLQGLAFGKNITISFGMKKLINEISYDVYVLEDCKTGTQKSAIRELTISGKRFVIACEGGFPEAYERKMAKTNKSVYFKSASYYLSCGSACDAYLASYGINMNKVYRYNHATFTEKDFLQMVPVSAARQRGLRNRFRLKENMFISTIDFTDEQGVDILLEIWKLAGINDADLLIISNRTNQKKLHKMVHSLALNNVVMLDYQPKELTRELLKISRAMIYPARYDAWGLPVVEALSSGTPVISSYNVGSVHDLVHSNRTGYIQNIDEPAGWGEHMRELLKRDTLYKSMQESAYSSMNLFTLESRAKTYIDVFKKCAIIQHK